MHLAVNKKQWALCVFDCNENEIHLRDSKDRGGNENKQATVADSNRKQRLWRWQWTEKVYV